MRWRRKAFMVDAMRVPEPGDADAVQAFGTWMAGKGASVQRDKKNGNVAIYGVGETIHARPGDYVAKMDGGPWEVSPADVFEDDHVPGPGVTWEPLDLSGRLAKRDVLWGEEVETGVRLLDDATELAEAIHKMGADDPDLCRAALNICVAAQALAYVFSSSPTRRERYENLADAARRNAFWTAR